jgi:hypothetical protein
MRGHRQWLNLSCDISHKVWIPPKKTGHREFMELRPIIRRAA